MTIQNRIKTVLILAAVAMAILGLTTTSAHADLVDGLVEYWALDGDYSAGVTAAHVGTLQTTGTGSGGFVSGKFGQGIDLENSVGNQASVVIGGDENDFDFVGQSMSVAAWYTTESLYVDWQALVAKGEGNSWRVARQGSSATDLKLSLWIIGDGELDQQDGSWHHVVATADADAITGGHKLYVDGNLVASNTNPANLGDSGQAMQIGGNPGASGRGWDGIIDDVGVWNRALTADEVSSIWNNGAGASIARLVAGGPKDPSPADGATVPVDNVDLSWTNMDPNYDGHSVYVDVWFGTEPNELDPGYDMTKVVTANPADPDRTTWTVSAPTAGTYYWQVNSYIYGPGLINEPNAIEGSAWSFNAVDDAPPSSVDAGDDMITWSGQPVPLDPNVVDDDASPLTYLWTVDPVEGVVVAFSDPSIEAPTVTITKVPVFVPTVVNGGFEEPARNEDDYGAVNDWTCINGTMGSSAGNWNIATDYGGVSPEGLHVGWAYADTGEEVALAQELTETLAADTAYTLTVEVGYTSYYGMTGYMVQLLAGGEVIAQEDDNTLVTADEFSTLTVAHTSGGVSDPNIGLPLQIRLWCLDSGEVEFDDVKLFIDGELAGEYVYDPAPVTVELTLAVNDEGNPTPVEDSMTIDVYEDACKAAVGAGLATIEPSDFDENCITDLRDLAVMLAQWLVDYKATAPVPKP